MLTTTSLDLQTPHLTPWVGLNVGTAIADAGIYAARANSDGSFSIPNVPPGTYQLVVWDDYLDLLISFQVITVTGGADVTLGEVPVFQWFTRIENWVYYDDNENGFRDDGEVGLPEQAVNLRWRDGSVYQSFPTDIDGFVPFDQVFPFFAWLVAEVDFARFKATGLTVTVDDGGPITSADPWSWDGQLTPQAQGVPTDPDSVFTTPTYRTEQGVVLGDAYSLSVGIIGSGKGGVTSDPAGIDCTTGTCVEPFGYGTVVTLTAAPVGGFDFVGWAGDCTGKALTCTVTMDQVRSVTANFYSFPWDLFLPASLIILIVPNLLHKQII